MAWRAFEAIGVAMDAGWFAPRWWTLLGRTLLLATGATALASLLGGSMAVILGARSFRGASFVRATVLTPLLLPPAFMIAVWERLAVPGGVLHHILPFVSDPERPFPIRNLYCAMVVLGVSSSPLLFFFVSEGIRSASSELIDAARTWRGAMATFFRIQLPLACPAIVAGLGITFTLAFLNYEAPRLLQVDTYPVLVNLRFEAEDSPGLATLFALPVFVVTATFLLGTQFWANRRGLSLSGRERGHSSRVRRRAGVLAWVAVGAWWAFCVVLPIGFLVSLAGSIQTFTGGLRTDWERILNGAAVCAGTALACVSLAAVTVRPERRHLPPWLVLLWLPVALPGTLLGSSLISLRGQLPLWMISVYDSGWILVIAGTLRFFPLAYFALAAHLRTIPTSQWRAARLASPARSVLRIYLPLALPGLVLGAVTVALFQSQELAATLLVSPPGYELLILRIYNLLHYDPERDLLAALSLFHVVSVLAVLVLLVACRPRYRA